MLDARVEAMFRAGLIEETRALLERYPATARPFGTIGYKEAAAVVRGEMSEADAIAETRRRTRAYAKRQMHLAAGGAKCALARRVRQRPSFRSGAADHRGRELDENEDPDSAGDDDRLAASCAPVDVPPPAVTPQGDDRYLIDPRTGYRRQRSRRKTRSSSMRPGGSSWRETQPRRRKRLDEVRRTNPDYVPAFLARGRAGDPSRPLR